MDLRSKIQRIILTLLASVVGFVAVAQDDEPEEEFKIKGIGTVKIFRIQPSCPEPSNATLKAILTTNETLNYTLVEIGHQEWYAGNSITESDNVTIEPSTEYTYTYTNLKYKTDETFNYNFFVKDAYGNILYTSQWYNFERPQYTADFSVLRGAGCEGQAVGSAAVNSVQLQRGPQTVDFEPLSYYWTKEGDASFPPHAGESQVDELGEGTYYVNIEVDKVDGNSCFVKSDPITVSKVDVSISANVDWNVVCKGASTGAATATVTNAFEPFTVKWDGKVDPAAIQTNNEETHTFTVQSQSLAAGEDMVVSVVDNIGCSAETTITITEPEIGLILKEESRKDLVCRDMPTGEIKFTSENGVGSVSYSWDDDPSTSSERTGLQGDFDYTITVTDEAGCEDKKTFQLDQPDTKVSVLLVNGKDPSCYGYSDGSITVKANGGTVDAPSDYVYEWRKKMGEDISLLTGTQTLLESLSGGDDTEYQIIAYDKNGCVSDTLKHSLDQPESMNPKVTINGDEITNLILKCDVDNASVHASASGGTGEKSYDWGNGEYGSTQTKNLEAGDYTINIKDANGCIEPVSVSIVEPEVMVITISEEQIIACHGEKGILKADVTGGSSVYTSYAWFNSNDVKISDGETSGLVAVGEYKVQVTDDSGCKQKNTYELTEPEELTVHISVSEKTCESVALGELLTDVQGGVQDYSYTWSQKDSPESTEETVVGNINTSMGDLSPLITYKLVVTDANGCTVADSIDMRKIATYQLNVNQKLVSCPVSEFNKSNAANTNDGVLTAEVVGGYAPFTVSWTDGAITREFEDVKERENVGKTWKTDKDYTNSDTGENLSKVSVKNVPVGNYTATVVDFRGCVLTQSVTLEAQPPIEIKKLSVTPSACKYATGSATVVLEQGTGNGNMGEFTYEWIDTLNEVVYSGVGASAMSITNISAQPYTLRITDTEGCIIETLAEVVEKSSLKITPMVINGIIHCEGGKTGSAMATAINDNKENPVFKYKWSAGDYDVNTGRVTNLPVGTHTVTVTDEEGCTASGTVDMVEDEILQITQSQQENVLCYGGSDGYITITEIQGGVEPYSMLWSNGEKTYGIANLKKGNYTVKVSDNSGCSYTKKFEVTEPDKLEFTIATTELKCPGNCDGTATITATGGVTPYAYEWSNDKFTDVTEANTYASLCLGNYTAAVTDANNCRSEEQTFKIEGRTEVLRVSSVPTLIFPKCGEPPSGKITVNAEGTIQSSQETGYSYSWTRNGSPISTTENSSNTNTISNLSVGTYALTLTDGTCRFDTTFTLKNSDITAKGTFVYDKSLCDGETYTLHIDNESIAGYHDYVWTNVETGEVVSNQATAESLRNGKYTVSAIDNTSCEFIDEVTIEEKVLEVSVKATDAICYGEQNGSVEAEITNTMGEVTYDWYSEEDNQIVASGQTISVYAGKYYVEAYDENHKNCKIQSKSVTVGQPQKMIVVPSTEKMPYCKDKSGEISVEVTHGVGAYTFELRKENGNLAVPKKQALKGSTVFTGVWADELFTVRVIDKNGCTVDTTKSISDIPHYTLQGILVEPVHCVGDANAELQVVVLSTEENTFEPYSYVWSHDVNETSNIATGLPAGKYQVSVTDGKGCKISYDFEDVKDALPMAIDFYESPGILCNGGKGNLLIDISSGGSGSYVYDWYDTEGELIYHSEYPQFNDLSAGTYKVVVTDKYGCSGENTTQLQEPSELTAIFSVQETQCGENAAVGVITLENVSGGLEGSEYRFRWNNDSQWTEFSSEENRVLSGLTAGEYSCTITNAKNPDDCYIVETMNTSPVMPMSIKTKTHPARCSYYTDDDLRKNGSDGTAEVTELMVSSRDYVVISPASLDSYTFTWDDDSLQTGKLAKNLIARDYAVTVTGPNGCSKTFDAGTVGSNITLTAEIIASDDSSKLRKTICLGDSLELTANVKARFYNGYQPSMEEVEFEWESVAENCTAHIAGAKSLTALVTPLTKYYTDSTLIRMTYRIDGCSSRPAEFSISHFDSVGFALEVLDSLGLVVGSDSVGIHKEIPYMINPVLEPWYANKIGDNGVESISWSSYKDDRVEHGTISDTTTNEKTYLRSNVYGLQTKLSESQYVYALAKTTNGCVERAIVYLNVFSSDFVPSGFSPNGDGVNDTWVIPFLVNCPEAKVSVFNRWGTKVFENGREYYSHPWNGTASNGNPLPIGTYYYVIEYNDKDHTPTKTGSISILR